MRGEQKEMKLLEYHWWATKDLHVMGSYFKNDVKPIRGQQAAE